MTLDEVSLAFREIPKVSDYVYLHLLGEPLLHENILDILDLAFKYNLKVNLTTNGSMLCKYYKSLLEKPALRQINVSLHSLVNYGKSKREEYMQTIASLIGQVTKEKRVYLSLRLWIENKDLNEEIISYLEKNLNIYPFDDNKLDHVYLSTDEEFEWPSINNNIISNKGMCYGGITHLGILSNGDVVICCLDTLGNTTLGNIFKDSIETILQNERYINYLKGREKHLLTEELCKRCSYHEKFNKEKI